MGSPLLIGSLVWLVVTIIAGWRVLKVVDESSNESRKVANLRYICDNDSVAKLSILLIGIQLWMMWITCYMHQQYPLIEPHIEF